MDHSYLVKNVSTPLSQQINQLAQNDPETKELWNYIKFRQPDFISILGSPESDSESIKSLLQCLKHAYQLALADFKAHPHGNREKNIFKVRNMLLSKARKDCIDETSPGSIS
ncbi:hypothetical protein SDC9_04181 [bioreactor metagenome]|uniref:Uncharacterized protein n=1 Tax=bioreactor metagenome TaxID=1076179 RepID=A0A644SWL0_9ZZZZ|nr:hypothetical protein [Negativicutes bacterium]